MGTKQSKHRGHSRRQRNPIASTVGPERKDANSLHVVENDANAENIHLIVIVQLIVLRQVLTGKYFGSCVAGRPAREKLDAGFLVGVHSQAGQ